MFCNICQSYFEDKVAGENTIYSLLVMEQDWEEGYKGQSENWSKIQNNVAKERKTPEMRGNGKM